MQRTSLLRTFTSLFALLLVTLLVAPLAVLHAQEDVQPATADTLLQPANVVVADGFDFPVGKPDGAGWTFWHGFNHANAVYQGSNHAGEDWCTGSNRVCNGRSAHEPVYAIGHGVVKFASGDYPGNVVVIEHILPNNEIWYSMYGHVYADVAVNQAVSRGQQIARIFDDGGNSHLHFEIRDFYIRDEINGANAACSQHRNYPPGPGYWPRCGGTGTPPDKGWVDPSAFIQARRDLGPTELICDNTRPNFPDSCFSQSTPSAPQIDWQMSTTGSPHSTNAQWLNNRAPNSTTELDAARWTPTIPQAGLYEVYIWYPATTSQPPATDTARYEINDRAGQHYLTWPQTRNGGQWNLLTVMDCAVGKSREGCSVRLDNTTHEPENTRRVWADAVKFVRLTSDEVVCDSTNPNGQGSCFTNFVKTSWHNVTDGGPYAGSASAVWNSQHALITDADAGRWTPNLPHAGLYDVYIWYPTITSPATSAARYEINDTRGQRHVTWDQRTAPGNWHKLAEMTCNAGRDVACSVRLHAGTPEASGTTRVLFDAVKFVRVTPEVICDNPNPNGQGSCFTNFVLPGTSWHTVTDGSPFNGTAFAVPNRLNAPVTDADVGRWTPTLPHAGHYEASVWYPTIRSSATSAARYELNDNNGQRSVTFNQRTAPGTWQDLSVMTCSEGRDVACSVRLHSGTSEASDSTRVLFDAVRFVRQPQLTITPSVLQPTQAIQVRATGFTPNGAVRRVVLVPNKQVYELTLQANADGSFGYDYTMPADAQFGLYKIRLQDVTTGAWSTIAEYDVIDQAATDRPAITMALGPASALNDQPSELMIRGHNFAFGAVVRFGKHTLSTNWVSSELLQATVPSGLAPATYDLAVLNPNGHRATLPNGFRVLDPEAELNDDMFSSSDQLWLNPSSPQVNMPVELGLIVQRQGGKRALESVPVAFRLNAADGPLLGTATIPFLDPPNSSESTAALQVRFPSAGPVTIYAIIDPDNSFAENNDTNNIISRTIQVVPTNADQTVPVVQQIHVNNGSTSTVSNPELSLNITATDPAPGSGVVEAHVIEYVYNEGARRWVPVNQSNWMAFSASPQRYNWSLRSLPGMHYVQVRVRDRAGNVSIGNAHQMINYEVASDTIARGQKRIYRYNVAAGQPFQVNLEVLDGDADLYVWSSRTDQSAWVSNLSGSANEQVSVPANAVVPGVYQVEVYGFSSATYRLTTSSNAAAANLANGGGGIDPEKLVPSEPIVPVASIPDERVGTFPVSALPVDTDVQRVYLPLVRR